MPFQIDRTPWMTAAIGAWLGLSAATADAQRRADRDGGDAGRGSFQIGYMDLAGGPDLRIDGFYVRGSLGGWGGGDRRR